MLPADVNGDVRSLTLCDVPSELIPLPPPHPQTDTTFPTVRVINTSTMAVATLAGSASIAGLVDGQGTNARFNWPTGIAVDSMGSVALVVRLVSLSERGFICEGRWATHLPVSSLRAV